MMFPFACPRCHTPLELIAPERLVCMEDGVTFHCLEGVWRMLLPERQAGFRQFIQEYETVRQAEGRGMPSVDYYRALPYKDISQRMAADWRIRAVTFESFIKKVLGPFERVSGGPLCILDLGAGNGWLSNRLAARAHQVAAVDLTTNDFDGLGCYRYYDSTFVPVQAEFEHLPVVDHSVDFVLFNASFHYAVRYETTLRESLRVLAPGGRIVIMDTPFYHDKSSGEKMVRERQDQFKKKFGFPSNALASENFLTYQRLAQLSENLGVDYEVITPYYGIDWTLRPWKARLLRRREPAKFHLVLLQKRR